VGKILNFPRAEYSDDIAHYIASGGSTVDNNYRAGLIFLACIIGGFAAIWAFILFMLKCRGEGSVGCASGNGFVRTSASGGAGAGGTQSKTGSTDDEDISLSVQSRKEGRNVGNDVRLVQSDSLAGSVYIEDAAASSSLAGSPVYIEDAAASSSFQSSLPSADLECSSIETGSSMNLEEYTIASDIAHQPSRRERRTQVIFLVFGLITLACVPLVLVFAFAPLKGSTEQADAQLLEARDVINTVQTSINTIVRATDDSIQIVEDTLLDLESLCPELAVNGTQHVFGFDLEAIFESIRSEYQVFENQVSGNISQVATILNEVESVIDAFEVSYEQVGNYMWVVPGVLLGLSILTVFTMFGVFVAWRQDSSLRLQRTLSWGILPLFIVFSIIFWIFAVVAAVTVAAGSDACTYGNNITTASPDLMVRAIIEKKVAVDSNDNVYGLFLPYVNGCRGGDPVGVLSELEVEVQSIVDYVWNYLSLIDSNAREELVEYCGSNNTQQFISGSRELAKLLSSIRRAIGSTASSLSCQRINPIYVEVVHDSICTDVATASSWGFVLFFAIGLFTLCLVSKRRVCFCYVRSRKYIPQIYFSLFLYTN